MEPAASDAAREIRLEPLASAEVGNAAAVDLDDSVDDPPQKRAGLDVARAILAAVFEAFIRARKRFENSAGSLAYPVQRVPTFEHVYETPVA